MIAPSDVAYAHDEMASEYDCLNDLWYAWLFVRLHEFIAGQLSSDGPPSRSAVDAGCGTGFQSFLLARAGYAVTGFDIARGLLNEARRKAPAHAVLPMNAPPLFQTKLNEPWLVEHPMRLAKRLEVLRSNRGVVPPVFLESDVNSFDYGASRPDVITCCGSVLSFVDSWESALARMADGLSSGGSLFLEVEQKINADLAWPLVDAFVGGRLGFDQPLQTTLKNLLGSPGRSVRIDYPFELTGGKELVLPIWLFSVSDLERAFSKAGLRVESSCAIHALTNIVPSTLLHASPPQPAIRVLFDFLKAAERRVATRWPFQRLGCSVVYHLKRRA